MSTIRQVTDPHARPSRDARGFAEELFKRASSLDHQSPDYGTEEDKATARLFRLLGHDVVMISERARRYEAEVEQLVLAVKDLLDDGGFAGSVIDARIAVRDALHDLGGWQ